MRAFLVACLTFVVIGIAGYFVLNSLQEPSGTAYTSGAARIDPSWSWRVATTTSPAQPCEPRTLPQWFFVDFRDPNGESSLCSDSQ